MLNRRRLFGNTAMSAAALVFLRELSTATKAKAANAFGSQSWTTPPVPTVDGVHRSPIPYIKDFEQGDWSQSDFLWQEVRRAFRDHGMLLEDLDKDITPIGAHYVLSHFNVPLLDPVSYRLRVGGAVRSPQILSMRELKALDSVEQPTLMECAGNGRNALNPRTIYISTPWFQEAIGTFDYKGVPLNKVLDLAKVKGSAVEVVFTGADKGIEKLIPQHYQRSLPIDVAMQDDVLLAFAQNGRRLRREHGGPLRLVVPNYYGMASVKWVTNIDLVTKPFEGYQQKLSYRYTQIDPFIDPGQPVTLIAVRAAMQPPGLPDSDTGARWVKPGKNTIVGKAWSGAGTIRRVEFSIDDGITWANAKLGSQISEQSWTNWSFDWTATPGLYVLSCRATDSAGNVQPLEGDWNYLGMAVNPVEKWRTVVPPTPLAPLLPTQPTDPTTAPAPVPPIDPPEPQPLPDT
jgi:sulfane dehydrogenase subunit SoxC